jgi:hypothetical protein
MQIQTDLLSMVVALRKYSDVAITFRRDRAFVGVTVHPPGLESEDIGWLDIFEARKLVGEKLFTAEDIGDK